MYARRFIAGALLLGSAACTKVQSISTPVPYIEANSPGQVWITTRSGTESMMYRPKVLEDSVFGFDLRGQQMTIPVDVVQSAKVKTPDHGKTFLVAGTSLVVVGVAAGLLINGASGKGTTCVNTATLDCRYVASTRGINVAGRIPVSATAKVIGGITRALLGSK